MEPLARPREEGAVRSLRQTHGNSIATHSPSGMAPRERRESKAEREEASKATKSAKEKQAEVRPVWCNVL